MKKEFETIATVFLVLLAVIGIFWATDISFHLMSQRSTFENICGLIVLILLVATLITFIIKKLKTK